MWIILFGLPWKQYELKIYLQRKVTFLLIDVLKNACQCERCLEPQILCSESFNILALAERINRDDKLGWLITLQ